MHIYLGGAIDHADDKARNLFNEVADALVSALGKKTVIFNPFSAFINANACADPALDAYVININNTALYAAEMAIFIWSHAQSFGVPLEIASRAKAKKPFMVLNVSGKTPGIYMRDTVINSGFGKFVESVEDLKTILSGQGSVERSAQPPPTLVALNERV